MIFLEIWKLINSCSVRTILHFLIMLLIPVQYLSLYVLLKLYPPIAYSQGSACGKTWSQT